MTKILLLKFNSRYLCDSGDIIDGISTLSKRCCWKIRMGDRCTLRSPSNTHVGRALACAWDLGKDFRITWFEVIQWDCTASSMQNFRALWDVSLPWFREFRWYSKAHPHRPSPMHTSYHTTAWNTPKCLAESWPEIMRAQGRGVPMVTTPPHLFCNGTTVLDTMNRVTDFHR